MKCKIIDCDNNAHRWCKLNLDPKYCDSFIPYDEQPASATVESQSTGSVSIEQLRELFISNCDLMLDDCCAPDHDHAMTEDRFIEVVDELLKQNKVQTETSK